MSTVNTLSAIVLAAGQGTRMKSAIPKPAHEICGRPMVSWVVRALKESNTTDVVLVVGHGAEQVTAAVESESAGVTLSFVEQRSQRGTGDAASVGLTGLADDDTETADVIILPGDTPLLTGETLAALVEHHRSNDSVCTVMTAVLDDPTGYGRIVRNRDGFVERIVEHRDCSAEELEINEVNAGMYCLRQSLLAPALRRITPNNAQGEYYLTDVVEVLRTTGYPVHGFTVADSTETNGVNDRSQLVAAELALRERINLAWMQSGVTILDPAGTPIDAAVSIGEDVIIHPGTELRGTAVIGDGATVGPATVVDSAAIGQNAKVIQSHVGSGAIVGTDSHVGPFAVIEPDAEVPSGSTVLPFTTFSAGSGSTTGSG